MDWLLDKIRSLTYDNVCLVLNLLRVDYRIVSYEGETQVVTEDLKPERVNIVILDGFVKEVYLG